MTKSKPENRINVMIVEDDELFRETIKDMINQSAELQCDAAFESCEEAISELERGMAPEVVLLDIDLPGMSGLDAIRHIKTLSPATKSIILTVFDDDDKIFNALCQGASGYLLKAASSEDIAKSIMDVVNGGAAMSPAIAAKVLTMFTKYSEPKKEYGLTAREKEILELLVNGMSKKHIAYDLHISLYTVDTHLKNIYAKLQVHSQIDVVAKALKERLI